MINMSRKKSDLYVKLPFDMGTLQVKITYSYVCASEWVENDNVHPEDISLI